MTSYGKTLFLEFTRLQRELEIQSEAPEFLNIGREFLDPFHDLSNTETVVREAIDLSHFLTSGFFPHSSADFPFIDTDLRHPDDFHEDFEYSENLPHQESEAQKGYDTNQTLNEQNTKQSPSPEQNSKKPNTEQKTESEINFLSNQNPDRETIEPNREPQTSQEPNEQNTKQRSSQDTASSERTSPTKSTQVYRSKKTATGTLQNGNVDSLRQLGIEISQDVRNDIKGIQPINDSGNFTNQIQILENQNASAERSPSGNNVGETLGQHSQQPTSQESSPLSNYISEKNDFPAPLGSLRELAKNISEGAIVSSDGILFAQEELTKPKPETSQNENEHSISGTGQVSTGTPEQLKHFDLENSREFDVKDGQGIDKEEMLDLIKNELELQYLRLYGED
ncbi:MAG: hypothetical protein ABUK01_00395 [Leptospirales bacterium]